MTMRREGMLAHEPIAVGLEEEMSVSDTSEDLQAVAEDLALDAQVLQRIEDEKLRTDPADPRLQVLSEKAVEIAEGLRAKAIVQRDLAAEAAEAPEAAEGAG